MLGILLIDSCEGKRIRLEKPVLKGGIFPPNYSSAAEGARVAKVNGGHKLGPHLRATN
jgi:hypothetical protein